MSGKRVQGSELKNPMGCWDGGFRGSGNRSGLGGRCGFTRKQRSYNTKHAQWSAGQLDARRVYVFSRACMCSVEVMGRIMDQAAVVSHAAIAVSHAACAACALRR
eukprot:364807-Chlamydomonas_euryale.AAC.5